MSVDELAVVDDDAAAGLADGGEEVVEPLCADVETWVEHVYAITYVRKISQTQRWCPQWWAHPEAIIRLTALWRTWESALASVEDAAIADWLRTDLLRRDQPGAAGRRWAVRVVHPRPAQRPATVAVDGAAAGVLGRQPVTPGALTGSRASNY